MGKTVVITGIGIISPAGTSKDNYWNALFSGKSCFRPITLFDTSPFSASVAGEIPNFDPISILGKKGLRELDRSTRLLSAAAKFAIEDSNLNITPENANSMGVSIGATFGSLHSIFQFDRVGLTEGPRFVNPSHFPNTVINSPASRLSIRFGLRGFNTTISTGFCAGIDALSYASDFIRLNRADVVLSGGVEELCEELFLGFHKLNCLSGMDGTEPISCPFDKRRNGLILSEGSAVFVLEDEDHATQRGAMILAKILGYGNAFDHSSDMSFNRPGYGLGKAIALALKDASLDEEDIDFIASCANSSPALDRMETGAIKAVFGKRAYAIPVSSIKSMIGESYSASGAFAIAAAVGALNSNTVPPTINYREKDPECDLDYVPNESRTKDIRNVLVLSSDPYGQNTAIIVGKYEQF